MSGSEDSASYYSLHSIKLFTSDSWHFLRFKLKHGSSQREIHVFKGTRISVFFLWINEKEVKLWRLVHLNLNIDRFQFFMLVSSSRNVLLSLIYYIKINPHHFLKNRILGLVINLLKIHREKYIEKDPFQAIFQFFSCLSRGTQRLASIIRLLVEWNINVWCCCYYNSTKKTWAQRVKKCVQSVFTRCF